MPPPPSPPFLIEVAFENREQKDIGIGLATKIRC